MADFLYVNLLNERKALQKIEEIPSVVRGILAQKVRVWTEKLRDLVVENITTRLKQDTGKLAQSVRMEVTQEGLFVEGRVYIAGVPYAKIQEEGGVTPPHIIRPHNAKVLAFYAATGNKVFAAHVLHPGGAIPATHFMKDAYREMSPQVTRGLRRELMRGLGKVKSR